MDPKNRRSFIALLGIAAIDNFGFALVFVMFAPLFLSPEYHFFPEGTSLATRNLYLAILFGAYPVTQFFGAPLLGDLADRIGRKKALIITVIGTIAGFALSGIACLFYSVSFLIISRLITGFFSGNLGICMSGIADISPTENIRARNFGILSTAWAVSWNIAMVVGGYLSNPEQSKWLSPAVPFWITALLTFISLIILAKYYTETHVHDDKHPFDLMKGIHNVARSLKIRTIRPFFLSILLWTIGWGLGVQWYGTFSILSFQAAQQSISWGLFFQGAFWALGGSLINPILVKRHQSLPISLVTLIGTGVLLVLASLPNSFLGFNLVYWPSATICAIAFSNLMNLASINAPAGVQGKVMGMSQSVMSLGWILVPILGATMGSNFTSLFYPVSGILILLGALVIFFQWIKKPAKTL